VTVITFLDKEHKKARLGKDRPALKKSGRRRSGEPAAALLTEGGEGMKLLGGLPHVSVFEG
jgi:hypothetical protein